MLTDEQEKLAKAAFQKTKLALDSAPNTWMAFRAAYELLMPVTAYAWHKPNCRYIQYLETCDCGFDAAKREAGL